MQNDGKIILKPAKTENPIYVKIILLVVAVAFIVAGSFMITKTNKDKVYYRETSAVITSIDEYETIEEKPDGRRIITKVRDVYVTYTVDDKTYEDAKLPGSNIKMKVGQYVTVTYDERKPETPIANAKESYGLAIGIIVAGCLICLAIIVYAVVLCIRKRKEQERIQKLIETGVKIRATVASIIPAPFPHFYCTVDGFDYTSAYFEENFELYTGCFVDIYFERQGFEARKFADMCHNNYYIDLNSVERGPYKEPNVY